VQRIDAVRVLQGEAQDIIRDVTKGGSNADLLAILFEQPYCRFTDVVERCRVSRPTATKWLNSLVDLGFLTGVKRGKTRLFINHRFLEILTRDSLG
jgi:Fic family protein